MLIYSPIFLKYKHRSWCKVYSAYVLYVIHYVIFMNCELIIFIRTTITTAITTITRIFFFLFVPIYSFKNISHFNTPFRSHLFHHLHYPKMDTLSTVYRPFIVRPIDRLSTSVVRNIIKLFIILYFLTL